MIGYQSGYYHTGGPNTFVGRYAGRGTTGTASSLHNAAFGYNALQAINQGDYNVAVGSYAADALTSGIDNTAVGYSSLGSTTTGQYNVAVGSYCLPANTTGGTNTAMGVNALNYTTTTGGSTAVGYAALKGAASQTGENNTGLGSYAGQLVTNGSNNTLVGHNAGGGASVPGGSVTTASNQVCIGNQNVTNAHIQVDWTIASDARDKTDVEDLSVGLDFVKQLKPKTYRWDKRSKYSKDQSIDPDGSHKADQLDVGFLAQDVEAIEEQYGYKRADKTNLLTYLSGDGEMYGITYSKLIPMLTKAVQELSAEVEELKKKAHNKCEE